MENLQFSFTLKTDDDCFVNVEAIIRVSVCNVSFISLFVLNKLVLVPLCTHHFGVFMLHVDSLFWGAGFTQRPELI